MVKYEASYKSTDFCFVSVCLQQFSKEYYNRQILEAVHINLVSTVSGLIHNKKPTVISNRIQIFKEICSHVLAKFNVIYELRYIADNIFTCATRRCLALSLEEPLLCAIGTMLLFTWNGSQHLRKDLVDIMTMDGKYHLPPDTVVPC
ncbi:hypothetical protein HUJ04_004743 [Dendroctonus ponderosae]|nr:hypothetical protein HUJ04_004743 [Dendroctonus ponderosae]